MSKTTIPTAGLADSAVTSAKITDATIASGDLADDAVTAAKIADAVSFGKVGQFLNTFQGGSFNTTSTSYTELTNFSQAITPSATNSKIFISAQMGIGMGGTNTYWIQMYRQISGSSASIIADNATDGSENAIYANGMRGTNPTYEQQNVTLSYLDSPSTTSEVTYFFKIRVDSSTVYVGRVGAATSRASSSNISTIEILA